VRNSLTKKTALLSGQKASEQWNDDKILEFVL